MEDLARVAVVILSSQGFSLLFSGESHKHSFMYCYACLYVYVENQHIQIKKPGVTLGWERSCRGAQWMPRASSTTTVSSLGLEFFSWFERNSYPSLAQQLHCAMLEWRGGRRRFFSHFCFIPLQIMTSSLGIGLLELWGLVWATGISLHMLRTALNEQAGLLLVLLWSLPGSAHPSHPPGLLTTQGWGRLQLKRQAGAEKIKMSRDT